MDTTTLQNKKITIIGSGVGGLATAALLAKAGAHVTVVEKNDYLGGRLGYFKEEGFFFDKGPSWYLMPDVFDHFFHLMGEETASYLHLQKLDPSYRIFFEGENNHLDFKSDPAYVGDMFEKLEKGAKEKFLTYLSLSKTDYEMALSKFMYKDYDSFWSLFKNMKFEKPPRLSLLSSMHSYVTRFFKNEKIQKILEYQLVFLGSSPYNSPALYNIMNHIDYNMGVFYPEGGMYEIAKALVALGSKHGAVYQTSSPVKKIQVTNGKASSVILENGTTLESDIVISNADYHHTEMHLLEEQYRQHNSTYWGKRTLAPSAHIMYLGTSEKIPNLTHHNLLFAKDWEQNFTDIFDAPSWPKNPSIYVCAPSVTDPTVAPQGKENLFILTPISSHLQADPEKVKEYGDFVLAYLEKEMGIPDLSQKIVYRKDYCIEDFRSDYNSLGGSALGLAHTLKQSIFFRPKNFSPKVKNLYYVGSYTNPGIGVPIQLISAEILLKRLLGISSNEPLEGLEVQGKED